MASTHGQAQSYALPQLRKANAVFVYLLRNKINGKCYVGKTTRTVKARWRQHRTEMRIGRYDWPLYRDMRAFGEDAFEIKVLGEADCQRRLNQMERSFIRKFNSVDSGYNQHVSSFGGRIRRPPQPRLNPLTESHRANIANSVRMSWIDRRVPVAC